MLTAIAVRRRRPRGSRSERRGSAVGSSESPVAPRGWWGRQASGGEADDRQEGGGGGARAGADDDFLRVRLRLGVHHVFRFLCVAVAWAAPEWGTRGARAALGQRSSPNQVSRSA